MDINSVEFYTLAFVVAMSLVALLMGRTEKKPPSTYIVQLNTTAADASRDDLICLQATGGGNVMLTRMGIELAPEETVNLVITISEGHCSIVEKKGVKRRGSHGAPVKGEALLNCLKPSNKYRVRYESQITSSWASFVFDTSSPLAKQVELKY